MEYDHLHLYGFGIDYLNDWKLELNKDSGWEKGDLAFKSPDKTTLFVSWGPLKAVKKNFLSPEEHAKGSLKKIKKGRGVKKVELIETKSLQINSHKACFNHIKILVSTNLLLQRTGKREIYSVHIYCESSQRFFVIYGTMPEGSSEKAKVYNRMLNSFRC